MSGRRQNVRRRIERAGEKAPEDARDVVIVWDEEQAEEEDVEQREEKRPKGRSKRKRPD